MAESKNAWPAHEVAVVTVDAFGKCDSNSYSFLAEADMVFLW